MRQTIHDLDVLTDEQGNLVGINLGYEYAAEHEGGIGTLMKHFGFKTEELGFDSRRNTLVPSGLVFHETKKSAVLVYDMYFDKDKDNPADYHKSSELHLWNEDKQIMACAWDERSFGIRVLKNSSEESKKMVELLKSLHKALLEKNGVLAVQGRTNPFGGTGLMVLDYTKIPENLLQKSRETDKANRELKAKLKKLEEESGVIPLLQKAGKRWIYLGANRLDDDGNPMWWLNPLDRDAHANWYTTEDLKLWAEDKGPVIEKESETND